MKAPLRFFSHKRLSTQFSRLKLIAVVFYYVRKEMKVISSPKWETNLQPTRFYELKMLNLKMLYN